MTESVIHIKDGTANPAPLGLLAFGTTTVLLNLHNAGFYEFNTMILAMGLCYGGVAQVIAGIMEWKKNNTFGTTAFTSYGLFWLSLVALVLLPKISPGLSGPNSTGYGIISCHLGIVYCRIVFRHSAIKPGFAVRFCVLDDPLLSFGSRRLFRQFSSHEVCRLRRHYLWAFRLLHWIGPPA